MSALKCKSPVYLERFRKYFIYSSPKKVKYQTKSYECPLTCFSKDVRLPIQLQRAMAAEAEAAREAKAKVSSSFKKLAFYIYLSTNYQIKELLDYLHPPIPF